MVRYGLTGARIAGKPRCEHEPITGETVANIKTHLGGDAVLAAIGASNFVADHDDLCFQLTRGSPNGVGIVVISREPRGLFRMDCYGSVPKGAVTARFVGSAHEILPENLATVLGNLAGIDRLHHRHY